MAVSRQVVAVVSFYMLAALVMVFVNKATLNSAPNLTVLFMFFQSSTTVLLLTITSRLTSYVEVPTIEYDTARKLAPLIFVDAAGFAFNAFCLRDVEAAFYQIARGLVLPLTILLVALNSRTRPAWSIVGCAAIVTSGFFIGVSFSQNVPARAVPTPLGLFYGLLSSFSIALHAVLVKSSLPYVNGSSTILSFWSNLGSAVLLGCLAALKGEAHEFFTMITKHGEMGMQWDWGTFLWGNIVTGIFGFLISIAGILSVKVTSPVTHMFSSAARSVLQIALGVKIFGDIITTQRAASAFIIIIGTISYTYIKSRETIPSTTLESNPAPSKDLESQSIEGTEPSEEKS
jgi:GDP-fucose transporter C1